MLTLDFHPTGHHFLQIPGPSPVPDRILRALSLPTIDHRGPEFGALGLKLNAGIKRIFKTQHPVMIYPSSGTGAWEAALVNLLSPGDHVVMYETGQFAALWARLAKRLGLSTEILEWPGSDSELPEAPGTASPKSSRSCQALWGRGPRQGKKKGRLFSPSPQRKTSFRPARRARSLWGRGEGLLFCPATSAGRRGCAVRSRLGACRCNVP